MTKLFPLKSKKLASKCSYFDVPFTESTLDFMMKHSDKDWDWKYISSNPNITMNMVEKYIDKPWDWHELSKNKKNTLHAIYKYKCLDKPWDSILYSDEFRVIL